MIDNHNPEFVKAWLAKWLANELAIKVEAIDTRKSFAQYDIDSTAALTLRADLEVWLGRQLSLTLAYDYPSIEALAQHLAQNRDVSVASPWSSLVKIQSSGSKPPFFGIHAHGGGVFIYYDLARHCWTRRTLASVEPTCGVGRFGFRHGWTV